MICKYCNLEHSFPIKLWECLEIWGSDICGGCGEFYYDCDCLVKEKYNDEEKGD